jgi:hypothetical protein
MGSETVTPLTSFSPIFSNMKKLVKKTVDKPKKVWHIMQAPHEVRCNSTFTTEKQNYFNFADSPARLASMS